MILHHSFICTLFLLILVSISHLTAAHIDKDDTPKNAAAHAAHATNNHHEDHNDDPCLLLLEEQNHPDWSEVDDDDKVEDEEISRFLLHGATNTTGRKPTARLAEACKKIRGDDVLAFLPAASTSNHVSTIVEEPLWVPLTEEEKIPYLHQNISELPFEHCALGQGRKIESKCDIDQTLWKWNENRPDATSPLANITNLLEYIAQRSPNSDSCNLAFFGDSLSSDHRMAATCQLYNLGYKQKNCALATHGPNFNSKYGNDTLKICDSGFENPFSHTCKKVFIASRDISRPSVLDFFAKFKATNNLDDFVILINWGVHCNDKNVPCMKPMIEESIIPFVKDPRFANDTFLFREHEPQHFPTSGGLYERQAYGQSCSMPLSGKYDNWRNEEALDVFKEHNMTKDIPIVPIYDALKPLWFMHASPDCTHYCYSPFRFDLTWDGMLKALKAYDGAI